MIDLQPAMAAQHDVVGDYDGQRHWSLQVELDWFCFNHRRSQVLAFFNGALAEHGYVLLDCSNFKRRQR